MIHVQPAFAVPLIWSRRTEKDGLNRELRDLLVARADDPRVANPNPYTARNEQLFESHFDFFSWPEPCVQKLKEFCWGRLMEAVAQLNGYDQAMLARIRIGADAWYHVTRRGGFFGLHNHPMASWSGVYCVDGGRHDADRPDSGLLSFINPFIMTTMFVDAGTAQMCEPYSHASRSWRLEAGQMVIFPSWLLHEVKAFHGEGERITVAFNAWFHVGCPQL